MYLFLANVLFLWGASDCIVYELLETFVAFGLSAACVNQNNRQRKKEARFFSKTSAKPKVQKLRKIGFSQILNFLEKLEQNISCILVFIMYSILISLEIQPDDNDLEERALAKLKKLQQWKNAKLAEFQLNQNLLNRNHNHRI